MRKSLAEIHLFNVVELFRRLAREFRRFGAGSADRLSEILDVIVLSDGHLEPAVAWAKALGDVEDEVYGEKGHTTSLSRVDWSDRYAQCWVYRTDFHWNVGFVTTGGHGLEVAIDSTHYDVETGKQVDGEIEVFADHLKSERFWGDDEGGLDENGNATQQVVESRELCLINALAVDDEEFANREAKARLAWLSRRTKA